MRSRILLLTLTIGLGALPTHLLSQTNDSAASQDKMSNTNGDGHMASHDKMGQDKMDGDKSDDHMSGTDHMSKSKKHKKDKKSDSMMNGSH